MLCGVLKSSKSVLKRHMSLLEGTFGLTEDQLAFQQVALNFAKSEMQPHAQKWDREEIFPKDVIKKAGELGFGGIYTSEDYGGSGLGKLEACLILEALSTGCMSTASYISIHNMCAGLLDAFGSQDQKQNWLEGVNSFDLFTSYCLTEPNSGSDAAAMQTHAKLDAEDYVLNGSKMFISGGEESDLYIVMAKTGPKEISTFLVEKGSPGLSFGKKEEKLAWRTQPTQLMVFDDVRVPKSNMLGNPGDGMKIALKGLEGGRLTIGSVAIGGAWYSLDKAKHYMKDRKQFGKPLHEFQHLQFKMADALAKLTTCRMSVRNIAQLIDQKVDSRHIFASIAKMIATDECFQIADDCMQMFGGYGMICEYGMERIIREIRILKVIEGTNEIMKHTIAKNLFKE